MLKGVFLRKGLVALASTIVTITIIVIALIILRYWRIPYFQVEVLGISHSAVHWIGWIGTTIIAFITPIYPIVKRKYSHHLKKIMDVHVTTNLIGVFFVSIHFTHQVTRPPTAYPDLGTGLVLYTAMILLTISGFMMISGIASRFFKQIRFFHPAYAITFYTVIIIHILQDLIFPSLFT